MIAGSSLFFKNLYEICRVYVTMAQHYYRETGCSFCAPLCNILTQCWYFDWQFAPSKLRAQISAYCLVQLVFRENSVVKAAVVHYNNISIRQDWIPHMVYRL